MYTLPVALALYSVGQNAARYGLMMAGAVVVVVPVLIVFVVAAALLRAGHRAHRHQVS